MPITQEPPTTSWNGWRGCAITSAAKTVETAPPKKVAKKPRSKQSRASDHWLTRVLQSMRARQFSTLSSGGISVWSAGEGIGAVNRAATSLRFWMVEIATLLARRPAHQLHRT